MADRMNYATYEADWPEKILLFIVSASCLAAAGILFYDTLIPAAAVPAVFIPVLKIYSEVMAGRRRERLRSQFRDLLDSLAASFAGGRHMREGLCEAEKELAAIYEDDDEIMIEIRRMLKRMDNGDTDSDVLIDLAERSGIEDIELFAQVFSICRETGGDMISAMTDASSMLGDKIKIENEIRALTSQKKSEGMIISVMPVVIIVFLRIIAHDYIDVLYGNLTGIMIMTLAISASIYSFYLIRKITEIEV